MSKRFFSKLAGSAKNNWAVFAYIAAASLILFLFTFVLNYVSLLSIDKIKTDFAATAWLIIVSLVLLAAGSFTLSGMIGIAAAEHSDRKIDSFWKSARRNWMKNMVIVALVWAVSASITYISIQTPRLIISFAGMNGAIALLLLIKVAGLLGILSFISLSNFVQVIRSKSVLDSIKGSVAIVKSNYLDVSWPLLVFYIVFELPSFLVKQSKYLFINDLVFALVVFPVFVWFFTNLTKLFLGKNDIRAG